MNIRSKKLWAGTVATSAVAALGLTLFSTSSAPAKGPTPAAKIKMIIDGGPVFTGDASVASGDNLKIVNQTNPRNIGPHTFSLIEEGSIPVTGKDLRKCAKITLPVCENVFKTHRVTQQFEVRRPNVDKGADGWDQSFNDTIKGDTWYAGEKGESETRPVSAAPGSTLYYFCLIHPEMRGSIGVTSR